MQALWEEPFRPAASCLKNCHILFVSSWLLLPAFGGLLFPGGKRRKTVGLCAHSHRLPAWFHCLHSRPHSNPAASTGPALAWTIHGCNRSANLGTSRRCRCLSESHEKYWEFACLKITWYYVFEDVVKEKHKIWTTRAISEYLKQGLFNKSIKYVSKLVVNMAGKKILWLSFPLSKWT